MGWRSRGWILLVLFVYLVLDVVFVRLYSLDMFLGKGFG